MTTYNEHSTVKSVDGFYKDESGNVVSKRLSTTRTRSRSTSKTVNTSSIFRLSAVFLCLLVGGIILSSTVNFTPTVFDSFENYTAFDIGLPRLPDILNKLSRLPSLPSITDFFNYQFIVGDWGIFEGLRGFLNLITSPFVFTGHLTTVVLSFFPSLIGVFLPPIS